MTNFIDLLGFGMVIPVFAFLFMESEKGLFTGVYTTEQLSFLYLLLVGSFSMGTFFGSPYLGALSDKYGRKRMLMFTYSANVVFYGVFALGILYKDLYLLFAGRFFAGLTGGSLLIVQSAIADISKPENKAANFGITGIAFGFGFIVGAILGGYTSDSSISPYFGYHLPFILSMGLTLVNIIFLALVFRETNLNKTSKSISLFTGPKNLIKAISYRQFRIMFIVIFLLTIGFNFFIQVFQFYVVDEFMLTESEVGLLYGFIGLCIAISQGLILRQVSKRSPAQRILLWSIPAFAISYLLLLIPDNIFAFAGLAFVMIIFQGLTYPSTLSVVSNTADDDVQGELMGINQSVQSFAAALPSIVFGLYIGDNYSMPMYVGAACTLLAWMFFLRLLKSK